MICNADVEKKYLARDNLLILHLTDRCNNKCTFCMVDEIHGRFSFPFETALSLIDQLPTQGKVDFFGGEPTLYPRFFDLLQYVQSRNLKCSIATNGRLFARQEFTERVAAIAGKKLYVRTSLYGPNAEIHDKLTGVPGSFEELLQGLERLVAVGISCQVNIVITKLNLPDLPAMTSLVIDKGVRRIKFGLIMDAKACADIVPTLSEIRPQLRTALQLATRSRLTVTLEKAPLCLVPEYMHECSSERDLGQWSRYFAEDGECSSCIVRSWCDGLDPEYQELFGTNGLHRIAKVPANSLTPFPSSIEKSQVRFLKFNLFSMPEHPIAPEQCETIMLELLEQAKQKFARIAFVPADLQEKDF